MYHPQYGGKILWQKSIYPYSIFHRPCFMLIYRIFYIFHTFLQLYSKLLNKICQIFFCSFIYYPHTSSRQFIFWLAAQYRLSKCFYPNAKASLGKSSPPSSLTSALYSFYLFAIAPNERRLWRIERI